MTRARTAGHSRTTSAAATSASVSPAVRLTPRVSQVQGRTLRVVRSRRPHRLGVPCRSARPHRARRGRPRQRAGSGPCALQNEPGRDGRFRRTRRRARIPPGAAGSTSGQARRSGTCRPDLVDHHGRQFPGAARAALGRLLDTAANSLVIDHHASNTRFGAIISSICRPSRPPCSWSGILDQLVCRSIRTSRPTSTPAWLPTPSVSASPRRRPIAWPRGCSKPGSTPTS